MISKKIAVSAASLALMAGATLPAFAEETHTSSTTPTTTSTEIASKIGCVGTAVSAREVTLAGGMTTYTAALNAAYAARGTALKAAYTNTTRESVRIAVRAAWSTFNASVKSARSSWKSTRDGAWKTYRAAAHACKAPSKIGDGGNADSEIRGN